MSAAPINDQGIYLGLDIGGTKIGLSVGTSEGYVLANDRMAVDHALTPEAILSECKQRLEMLVAQVQRSHFAGHDVPLFGLGAACPGPLDYARGAFINPPNNPKWHGFVLRDWLKHNFTCPTAMMNDANAAALAEFVWGAASGTSTSVFLTCSTGMGAGLIVDGKLYEGPLGLAGEIGRIRLSEHDEGPVGFGRRGSMEGYCSGPGISQMAQSEAIVCTQTGEVSELVQMLARDGRISVEALCEAAQRKDEAAMRVLNRSATQLGKLLAVLTDILNPDIFVLGTIPSAYPELFIPRATEVMRAIAIPEAANRVRVVGSGLSDRGSQQALAIAVMHTGKAPAR